MSKTEDQYYNSRNHIENSRDRGANEIKLKVLPIKELGVGLKLSL